MNILILHGSYQQPGGEDVVVRNEAAMLERAGYRVSVELVSNEAIRSTADKVRTALRVGHDPDRTAWMEGLLDRACPDIVHVHNFFPLLTSSVHAAAARAGAGVVQTLHNYRLLCAAATFERDGAVCEKCLHGSRLNAIRHRCYRNSALGSAALVRMQAAEARHRRLATYVDRFICLTRFARDKFVEGGLPPGKLCVKPNFFDRVPHANAGGARSGALYVGRLSREKGVRTLIEAWREVPGIALRIAGDGPLYPELKAISPSNVAFLGRIDATQVEQEMRAAELLVVPSLWYEGFPMTIVEAFSCGLPVAASRLGSLAEIIEPGRTGELFAPNDPGDLARTVKAMLARPDRLAAMGEAARATIAERYTAQRNLPILEAIYAEAIEAAARRRQACPRPS